MKINWLVRIKNPVFWVNLAIAVFLPMLTYMGLNWSDMTTWAGLCSVLAGALSNPVIVVSVIVSAWNALNDPTTKGLSDSARALLYPEPGKDI